MTAAIRGSTELLEKVSRLGKILSLPEPSLRPVDLRSCVDQSIQLVKDAYPERILKQQTRIRGRNGSEPASLTALADELLEEAFVNVYSNCVKYTEGSEVPIETLLEEVDEERGNRTQRFWRVSIVDRGVGVPDDAKGIFIRYRSSHRGKGLGLSIVHALVVGRYSGSVTIRNRVEGDYTQGSCVQMLIPAHPQA